jgi:peptidyl-prolyl cis-trans isomerase B (cyclophilin B)
MIFLRTTANRAYRPLMAIALAMILFACSAPSESATNATDTTAADATQSAAVAKSVPGAESPLPKLMGKATVVLTVKGKPITLEVNGADAPITAGNFVDLVQRKVYDGTLFHRVVPQFVAQGGDPMTKDPKTNPETFGTGSFIDPKTKQPRYIPLEILPEGAKEPVYGKTLKSAGVSNPPKLKHGRGALAMARSMLPDSASSQFYVALTDQGTAPLDGDYAVFGMVTAGMDVVDQIQMGDRIDSAQVTQGMENLK